MDEAEETDSNSITKKTIIKILSHEMQLPQTVVKDLVERFFDVIVDCLVVKRRLELRNFGVFEVKKRAARRGRNPRTKETYDIAPRYAVTFRPGKLMEDRLRRLIEESETRQEPEPPVSEPPVPEPPST